jgi:hypothetical protein
MVLRRAVVDEEGMKLMPYSLILVAWRNTDVMPCLFPRQKRRGILRLLVLFGGDRQERSTAIFPVDYLVLSSPPWFSISVSFNPFIVLSE